MIEAWLRAAETIAQMAVVKHTGVLGFVSPDSGANVSALVRTVAEVLARSGEDVLVVDFTQPIKQVLPSHDLSTSHGMISAEQEPAWQRLNPNATRYSTLAASPNSGTQFLFNNVAWLQSIFADQKVHGAILLVDIPPVFPSMFERKNLLNPLAIAASCDSVLLVCPRGKVIRLRLKEVVDLLRVAGTKIVGTVLDEANYTAPGEEMARSARMLAPVMPRLARWLERQAMNSTILR
jgi:Mrp family chromosome partitioning ATPase